MVLEKKVEGQCVERPEHCVGGRGSTQIFYLFFILRNDYLLKSKNCLKRFIMLLLFHYILYIDYAML